MSILFHCSLWISTFPAPFLKNLFSQMHVFGAFLKNQVAEAAWIYFWVFFFNSVSLLLCWYHAAFVIVALLALFSS